MRYHWARHISFILLVFLLPFMGNSQNNNLANLTVIVKFQEAPTSVNIVHTPLKYNKKFALSFTMDDGGKDTYTHAFKFLTGGRIDGTNYSPLYYSDGCGNDINFTMSTAIYSISSYQEQDAHEPGSDYAILNVTWPEISEMYKKGCGVLNHGLSSSTAGDVDYLIAKNHSYIKRKTQDAVPGGIHSTIFVNPNGASEFTSPAFNQNYNAAFRMISYGEEYLNVNSTSSINNIDALERGRLEVSGVNSLATIADGLYNKSITIPNTTPWASTFNHSVTGGAGYSFSNFKTYLQDIADTYGKNGLDNIWFTTEEEVMDYVLLRDKISISQETIGDEIHITFSGDTPKNLRTYALSLEISSNASDIITGITIDGDTRSSYSALNETQILINAEFDGSDLPSPLEIATIYVDSTELSLSQNVADIALDYVMLVPGGAERDALADRLCSIAGISVPDEFCSACSTSISKDTTICIGACVELSAPDATSYKWSTGQTSQSITVCPSITTEYSVTVTNDEGCEATDSATVTVIPAMNIQSSNDSFICPDECITIWTSGGDNYQWSNGQTTDTIEVCPTEKTKYLVDISNHFGCVTKDSVEISLNNLPTPQVSNDVRICRFESTILSASGGVRYEWSNGESTQNITVSPAETTKYYVSVYNETDCAVTDSISVTVTQLPNMIGGGIDTVICVGECIELTANGGLSYLWSTNETTESIDVCPTANNTYYVYINDQFNCSNIDSINVLVKSFPLSQTSNNTIICSNQFEKIWVSGGDNYKWDTGETTDTIFLQPTEAKKHYVTVCSSFGCETVDSVFVDVHPAINANAGRDLNVYKGDCISLTATGGTSCEWNTGETTNTIDICPTETTNYSVTAYDGNGCSDSDSVLVIYRSPQIGGSATVGVNSIIVTFESNPSFVDVSKTPLKYNKEFALSMHIKNANKETYTHAFPFLNGGSIDGVNYPGLTFTDGCDNELNFKMGTSINALAADGITDIHDQSNELINWEEAAELYLAGWGIFNQGLLPDNSGDPDYSIARNHSYVKFKTHELISGGIPMNVLMNPQKDNSFTTPAFRQDYRASFSNHILGIPYTDLSLIPNSDSLKMSVNPLDAQQSLASIADAMHNNYNPSTRLWASADISTITDGNTLGYSFSVFSFYMEYIESKYGSSGLDNIWMTNEDEVWDYLTAYDLVTVNRELLDNRLLITFTGSLPTHLNNYALSLLVESDATIESVQINGGTEHTSKIKSDTSALINFSWDGSISVADDVIAENYVVLAESSRTTNDALVAMDYVNILYYGPKKVELRNRLCAITEATLPPGYCSCEFSLGKDTLICTDDCIDLIAPDGTSYLWSTGESSQSIEACPTKLTEYWVTAFNEYDCYATDTIQIDVNPDNFADAGLNDTICELSCVNLTASSGSAYIWSNGENTQTINVCPDTETKYYVDVTNAIGCVSKDSVIVSLYDLPTPIITEDVNLCVHDSTTLTISGGSDYLWSTGESTTSIKVSPVSTTTYYVWINNENNCQVMDSVTVYVIQYPIADAGADTSICAGDCITLNASGGYSYEWDNGEATQSTEVCPTDSTNKYYVTVTDPYSCSSIDSVTVYVNPIPISQTSNDTIVCPNQCVKIWASGGSSYLWDTGETTDTIEVCPDVARKYYVSVINDLNCAAIDSVFVNVYSGTNANAGGNVITCPGNCITLTATGGYKYEWNTGDETNSIEVCPDTTTQYSVTVYNEFECQATDEVTITLRTPPIVDAGNDVSKCISDCVTLAASGDALVYYWSNGSSNGIFTEVCPTVETTYYVEGRNQFGCSATDSVTVRIDNYSDVNLLGVLPAYCEGASAVLLEGTPANGTFGGSSGVSGNIFSPINAGIGEHKVYYSVINNAGCLVTDTVTVNIYEIPNFSLGADTTLCTTDTLEIFTPTGYDQYLWSNGNTSFSYHMVEISRFGLGTTLLELVVTDNGCVASDEIEITFESCNVGIEDLEDLGISIYPNPNSGVFKIAYDGTKDNQYFSIFNMQGQEVYFKELNECNDINCSIEVDANFLKKGMYVIRFVSDKAIRTGKLILQ